MKTPKKEIERAKTYLEDYKERLANGKHFTTREEFEKELNFTPEETARMNKKIKKITNRINNKNTKSERKAEKHLEKYVKV